MLGDQSGPRNALTEEACRERLIPECWNAHDREFPLLPAIEGSRENDPTRRKQRNAGRQRSGSDRHDTGRSNTCSDVGVHGRSVA